MNIIFEGVEIEVEETKIERAVNEIKKSWDLDSFKGFEEYFIEQLKKDMEKNPRALRFAAPTLAAIETIKKEWY